MERHRHVIHIFVIAVMLTGAFAIKPGVKMRVSQKGIAYANTVAQAAVRKHLRSMNIDNQYGSEKKYSWSLTSFYVRGMDDPSTQIRLNPYSGGLTFDVSNFGIRLRANWGAKYRVIFKVNAGGHVFIDVERSSLSITVTLGQKNGRPSVTSRDCRCQIGSVKLKFHGGFTAFILNLFKKRISREVQGVLQSRVCDIVAREVNSGANAELAKMNVNDVFARYYLMDYSLVAPPVVTSSYLETLHKGVVYWNSNRQESSFSPGAFPAWNDANSMLYVFLSDYTPNTFLYAAHRNGYLTYNVTTKNLPYGKSNLLDAIPQVEKLYPNSWLELRVSSKAVPTVKMDYNALSVSGPGEVEVVAHTGGAAISVFTLSVKLSFTSRPSIVNEKLTATIVDHSVDVSILKSVIPNVDLQELKPLLDNALKYVLIPEMNKLGSAGIDLPVAGDIKFYNTKLKVLPGALLVSTDLRYK